MNKMMLVTRPRHDETTNYLYYWAKYVIAEAENHGVEVIDLEGKKANYKDFSGRIKKLKPDFLFLNGHGNPNVVTGHNNETLLEAGQNETLTNNKIVYALSCSSAQVLGQKLVDNGTKSFIGYEEDFIFMYDKEKITRPIDDKTAELFLRPSNIVAISLIKGNTSKQAYDKSQKGFKRNLRSLMNSESPQQDRSAIPWLYWDMIHQKCLGNTESKI